MKYFNLNREQGLKIFDLRRSFIPDYKKIHNLQALILILKLSADDKFLRLLEPASPGYELGIFQTIMLGDETFVK